MSHSNDGGFANLFGFDWGSAREYLVSVVVALRADRMVEAVVIAVVVSGLTTAATYVLVITRLDERVTAMQKDMDSRTAARKEADAESKSRIERVENRLVESERAIALELAAVREALGRVAGRQDKERH